MKTIRLYSFMAPLSLLPIMDFSFGEIPDYLKGLEFRNFVAEILTQLIVGVFDAIIIGLFQGGFAAALG